MTRARDIADQQDNLGGAVAPYVAGKNGVINGAFDIWQRGTSVSGAGGGAYTADRWFLYAGGQASLSRQTTGDTTNLPNIQYCARVQRANGSSDTTTFNISQSFETSNSIQYAGKTVTMSFYARKGANFSPTSSDIKVYFVSGTGTDQRQQPGGGYTGQVVVINSSAVLTTSWQRFTYTGTVATTATEVTSVFEFVPTGTAGAADYFEITGVQLEIGSLATPFSRAGGSIGGELALCQRYYWRATATGTIALGSGTTEDANRAWIMINNPVPMRIAPTSVDASTLTVTDATSYTLDVTSVTGIVFGTNGGRVTFNTSGGQTTNRAVFGQTKSTGGYIGFSAEL